ncbi:MAG: hypothetical protein SZ59_C0002G0236 [candidate division TM6 bacterium GW2011_GWF2_28_16]|nr:MAG: hypothetical protein SZ59_C0002G0236 [candidate division TM6 bacterium GW2011_GWF2_28_16]
MKNLNIILLGLLLFNNIFSMQQKVYDQDGLEVKFEKLHLTKEEKDLLNKKYEKSRAKLNFDAIFMQDEKEEYELLQKTINQKLNENSEYNKLNDSCEDNEGNLLKKDNDWKKLLKNKLFKNTIEKIKNDITLLEDQEMHNLFFDIILNELIGNVSAHYKILFKNLDNDTRKCFIRLIENQKYYNLFNSIFVEFLNLNFKKEIDKTIYRNTFCAVNVFQNKDCFITYKKNDFMISKQIKLYSEIEIFFPKRFIEKFDLAGDFFNFWAKLCKYLLGLSYPSNKDKIEIKIEEIKNVKKSPGVFCSAGLKVDY